GAAARGRAAHGLPGSCADAWAGPRRSRKRPAACQAPTLRTALSSTSPLELDLDERVLALARIDDVVVHAGLAEIRHAALHVGDCLLAARRDQLQPSIRGRHHHVIHLVHVEARLRAGCKPPFGHADPIVVDLHRGYGPGRRHFKSSGKNLNTDNSGLGAAWPSPQIEASAMTWERSSSSSLLQ